MQIKKSYIIRTSIIAIALLAFSFAIWLNGILVTVADDSVSYDYRALEDIYDKKGWPRDFNETDFPGNKKGLIIDDHSGLKYLCTAKKNVYVYFPEKKTLHKILVMLPKPYRTNIWPFGKEQNTVMYVSYRTKRLMALDVAPEDIIELTTEQKVGTVKSNPE